MRTFILCAILLAASVAAVPQNNGEDAGTSNVASTSNGEDASTSNMASTSNSEDAATGSNVDSTSNQVSGSQNAVAGPSDQSRRLYRLSKLEEQENGGLINLRPQDWYWTGEPLVSNIRPADPTETLRGLSVFDSKQQAKDALVKNNLSNVGATKYDAEKKSRRGR
jgi:hypothetical protein